jgi:polyphosphate kinase
MKDAEALPLNRELSQLAFNRRVLALADDATVPLLERLRFLCIVGSNLDEFFEIRVAGIKEQLRLKTPPAGMALHDVRALLAQLGEETRALIAEQYRALNDEVLPGARESRCQLVRRTDFTAAEREWTTRYFQREVRPLLTPIGLDPAHPFPQVVNKSLEFRHRAFRPGCFRARHGDRNRQGAAGAAADHQAAPRRCAA